MALLGAPESTNTFGTPAFGGVAGRWRPSNVPPPTPTVSPQSRLYNTAVGSDAAERGNIMDAYRGLSANAPSYMSMPSPNAYSPTQQSYNSGSSEGAISNLQNLSQTGGYTPQNIQDMRARSISPIRAIYANAQRDIDRNRRIQGGFSPNYNAAKAKMARQLSADIGDRSQQVEGDLAQAQAQGRLGIAGTYASAAGQDTAARNAVNAANTNATNQASQFNLQFPLQVGNYNNEVFRNQMAPIQGMQSLYGTTPAQSALFGNQVLQSTGLQNQMDQQNQENQLRLLGTLMGRG